MFQFRFRGQAAVEMPPNAFFEISQFLSPEVDPLSSAQFGE